MMTIAWRNLVRDRTRLAVAVGGVAFSVLLILLLQGLYRGVDEQSSRYLRSVGGDVWVGQAGTRSAFGHSVSVVPLAMSADLAKVDGVRSVAPLIGRALVAVTDGGADADLFLMGYDPSSSTGGPPGYVRGARDPGPGELIIDQVFAEEHGLGVGDGLEVAGRRLQVAGIGSGGTTLTTNYAWARVDEVARLAGAEGTVTYFVLQADRGVSPSQLARSVQTAVPGTAPTPAEDFIAESTADIRESFLPILFVLVVIALVVGSAVIGLTIYTSVLEKRQEYGVLKALGVSSQRMIGIVWRQALVAGAFGLAVGVPLTVGVSALITAAMPAFETALEPVDVALVAGAVAVMSLLASVLPLRRVTKLDPAEVFRV